MPDTAVVTGVSKTLQSLLADRVEAPPNVTVVPVTISTPQPDPGTTLAPEATRLNLFLYQVTGDPHLQNQESPGRSRPGDYGHPPLCLKLHYLLTPYGSTDDNGFLNETRAQFVLGSAMRVLHDHADLVEGLVTVRAPSGQPVLDPTLLDQPEPIRLTLEPLGLDELTKIWTALTLPYRLSAAYEVGVARIESRRPRRATRLVGEPPAAGPRIRVAALRTPRIVEVRVHRQDAFAGTESALPHVRIGDTLILRGTDLDGADTRINLGGLPIPVTQPDPRRAEVVVPDATLPGGIPIPDDRRLQPGPQPVTVLVGFPDLPGRMITSNRAVVMLVPQVTGVQLVTTTVPRTLTIAGTRLFRPDREGESMVETTRIDRSVYTSATSTQVSVPLPDVLPSAAVHGLLSAALAPFPQLPNTLELDVTIGNESPGHVALTGKPTSAAEAARLLQTALRDIRDGSPRFRGARVTTTSDSRLVIIPGGLADPVVITAGPAADALGLATPAARPVEHARTTGPLLPFPTLTESRPRLGVTIGADSATIELPRPPVALADAAELLEAALRSSAGPGFSSARVAVLDQQLLLVPGTDTAIDIATAGADTTSPAELQWRSPYAVRVRVDGVESIDPVSIELP